MLKASGVVKRYRVDKSRYLTALDGVDMVVEKGLTAALVGESGCGKSTLARLLLRLEKPDEGQLAFDGADLWQMTAGEVTAFRRQVQMIFQDPFGSLNPRMKVSELVGEGLVVHKIASGKVARARVEELLALVGLPRDSGDKYPHQFSGGQRQRICIARALAVEPSLLIADEPISALDVSIQAQILKLLDDIRQRMGVGVLLISHDLRVVRAVAKRVSVMYLGTVVESGPTDSVFSDPKHPYTVMLLEAVPSTDPAESRVAQAVSGDPPSPVDKPEGCPFHPRCTKAFEPCYHVIPEQVELGGGACVRCHLYR